MSREFRWESGLTITPPLTKSSESAVFKFSSSSISVIRISLKNINSGSYSIQSRHLSHSDKLYITCRDHDLVLYNDCNFLFRGILLKIYLFTSSNLFTYLFTLQKFFHSFKDKSLIIYTCNENQSITKNAEF